MQYMDKNKLSGKETGGIYSDLYEQYARKERHIKSSEKYSKRPDWNINKPGKRYIPASERYPKALQKQREESKVRRQLELLQLVERNSPGQLSARRGGHSARSLSPWEETAVKSKGHRGRKVRHCLAFENNDVLLNLLFLTVLPGWEFSYVTAALKFSLWLIIVSALCCSSGAEEHIQVLWLFLLLLQSSKVLIPFHFLTNTDLLCKQRAWFQAVCRTQWHHCLAFFCPVIVLCWQMRYSSTCSRKQCLFLQRIWITEDVLHCLRNPSFLVESFSIYSKHYISRACGWKKRFKENTIKYILGFVLALSLTCSLSVCMNTSLSHTFK